MIATANNANVDLEQQQHTVGREIGKTIGMATIDGIAKILSPSVPLTSEKWPINHWKGKF